MDKIMYFLKDIIKSLKVGIIVSVILILSSALFGAIAKQGNIILTLDIVKNTLFFIGALGLFVFAGFTAKRESRRPLEHKNQWKEHFKVLNFVNVLMVIDITILVSGILLDRVILYM